jgi:hypothetical protein
MGQIGNNDDEKRSARALPGMPVKIALDEDGVIVYSMEMIGNRQSTHNRGEL